MNVSAFTLARAFGRGRLFAAWLQLRKWLTGSTGRYRCMPAAMPGVTVQVDRAGRAAPAPSRPAPLIEPAPRPWPEWALVDPKGQPRQRYVQVSRDGSRCVLLPHEVAAVIGDDDPAAYELRSVYLSLEEFNALPEFGGF